jgi:hypothetical protein
MQGAADPSYVQKMNSLVTAADESFQRVLPSMIGQGSERFWIRHYPYNTASQSLCPFLSGYWWLVPCSVFALRSPLPGSQWTFTRKTLKPNGQGLSPLSHGKPLQSPSSADTTLGRFGTYNPSCAMALAAKLAAAVLKDLAVDRRLISHDGRDRRPRERIPPR